jgi:hypothetical protein
MNRQQGNDEVIRYLSTFSMEEPPYDFNGLLHLILVGVDNLRAHSIEADFLDFACSITNEQAAFLQKLLDSRARVMRISTLEHSQTPLGVDCL